MSRSNVDPRWPTDPVSPSYAEQSTLLGWIAAECWDHLWPWSKQGRARHRAIQLAGGCLALVATLAWVWAAMGHLQAGAIIAWWFGWSVYEVRVRLSGKRYVKDGPWWGRQYRVASVMDMICYVGFKNLLLGSILFLTIKSLGWMVV